MKREERDTEKKGGWRREGNKGQRDERREKGAKANGRGGACCKMCAGREEGMREGKKLGEGC